MAPPKYLVSNDDYAGLEVYLVTVCEYRSEISEQVFGRDRTEQLVNSKETVFKFEKLVIDSESKDFTTIPDPRIFYLTTSEVEYYYKNSYVPKPKVLETAAALRLYSDFGDRSFESSEKQFTSYSNEVVVAWLEKNKFKRNKETFNYLQTLGKNFMEKHPSNDYNNE